MSDTIIPRCHQHIGLWRDWPSSLRPRLARPPALLEWTSQPVPDKYAFQATDTVRQTDEQKDIVIAYHAFAAGA